VIKGGKGEFGKRCINFRLDLVKRGVKRGLRVGGGFLVGGGCVDIVIYIV
jgi:hypothetical protein